MNNNQSIALLQKLIQKTKDNSIHWKKLSSSHVSLKPLPASSILVIATQPDDLFSLDREHSYVYSYENGMFALLAYQTTLGHDIYLRVQTDDSPNSHNCVSTISNNDVDEISQLKRLYNLVDSSYLTYELENFIDDFLKNA